MISVIVCTYNRTEALAGMLRSFFQQKGLEQIAYELLLVDNNSTDSTADVYEEFKAHREIRYLFEPKQGLSAARNRGVQESRGEILAFLDDDVLVDPHWLRELNRCYAQTQAEVVGGRCRLLFSGDPPGWLGPAFRTNLAEVELGEERKVLTEKYPLYGANLSFRKSTLQDCGGFLEQVGRTESNLLSGEETLLIQKITGAGGKIVYEPTASVQHRIGAERLCWDYFQRIAKGEGQSMALADPYRSGLVQALRIIRAGQRFLFALFHRFYLTAVRAGEYERKNALRKQIIYWNYLCGRWKRFWESSSNLVIKNQE